MIQQFMMQYLRKRGWIIFWLDKESQHCSGVCWLKEYLADPDVQKYLEKK